MDNPIWLVIVVAGLTMILLLPSAVHQIVQVLS
jgi:hypothetical protein